MFYWRKAVQRAHWSVKRNSQTDTSTEQSFYYICTHYHIDLSIGVSHIADNAAILHSVELFSSDNVLVACE